MSLRKLSNICDTLTDSSSENLRRAYARVLQQGWSSSVVVQKEISGEILIAKVWRRGSGKKWGGGRHRVALEVSHGFDLA